LFGDAQNGRRARLVDEMMLNLERSLRRRLARFVHDESVVVVAVFVCCLLMMMM